METQKSFAPRFIYRNVTLVALVILGGLGWPGDLWGQVRGQPSADSRPRFSDQASRQLITNYLEVTGGAQAHEALRNVFARGRIKESTLERHFELIETSDGKRWITYDWIHLGRAHREIEVHDGLESWKQVLLPERSEPTILEGPEGQHFGEVLWLLPPFTLPRKADYVFNYSGSAKVKGRPAHVVKGMGKGDRPCWFYFDQENFLLTRWGAVGAIAEVEEYLDYQSTRFQRVAERVFPAEIELLAEESVFGRIVIEEIRVNEDLEDRSFMMPRPVVPMLRQRPIVRP